MNNAMLKMMLKPMVPKLESWLRGQELEEGEKRALIMLDVSNSDLIIKIVAMGQDENGYPKIMRVLSTISGDSLLQGE